MTPGIYDVYRQCLQNLRNAPNADEEERNNIWEALREAERRLIEDARSNTNARYALQQYALFIVATIDFGRGANGFLRDETRLFARGFRLERRANAQIMDDFATYCHKADKWGDRILGDTYINIAQDFCNQLVKTDRLFWQTPEFRGLRAYVYGGLIKGWRAKIKQAFRERSGIDLGDDKGDEENGLETIVQKVSYRLWKAKLDEDREYWEEQGNEHWDGSRRPFDMLEGMLQVLEGNSPALTNDVVRPVNPANPYLFWLDLCDYLDGGDNLI